MEAIMYSGIAALFFGMWPLVMRFAQLSPAWINFIVVAGSFPVVIIGLLGNNSFPSRQAMALGIFAGILNGVGILAYGKLIGGDWDISKTLLIALALMPLVVAVGSKILFNEEFTINKTIGLFLAMAAIFFLNK